MKTHILFHFRKGAGGGGNQFLSSLRDYFLKEGVYAENPKDADVILFNSHHLLEKAFFLKKKHPNKVFVHRIDGPISTYRKKEKFWDKAIFEINDLIADAAVFQSEWSQEENKKLFPFSGLETVIHNGADEAVFNRKAKSVFNRKKVKLVSTSWSSSFLKGFDILQFLDKSLDFSKYAMTFVGNSPVGFKRIKSLKPVSSRELASILKSHDIFIAPSKTESCSNALIEALSCGLPSVAFNSSSYPEVLKEGGELFFSKEDILGKIEKVKNNYFFYQSRIPDFSLTNKAKEYYGFFEKAIAIKRINLSASLKFALIKLMILKGKIINKL